MINVRASLHVLSALLLFLAVSLVFPLAVSLIYGESTTVHYLTTIALAAGIGFLGYFTTKATVELRIKDGFIIVTMGWIIFAAFGALPFYLSSAIPSYTDSFFETMSGFTTTGASILTEIESLPHSLLFWRSFTHWLGGMGIILLSLAILPLLGIGGMQLFKAEVPGPSPDKLSPRIRETAKLLWFVYVLITVVETALLMFADMNLFDALCHSFGTVATGGFSTKNTSVAYYNSAWVDYILTAFMVIAGINFSLHYQCLNRRISYWKDEEFRFFIGIIFVATLIIGVDVFYLNDFNFSKSLRETLFQVVSIITTTGFGSADYETWSTTSQLVLFVLMFIGGCAGSTGGGMKVVRILVLIKFCRAELKRMLHPQAVLPVRLGERIVPRDIVSNIAGYFLIYMLLFAGGIIFMSSLGLDLPTSLGSVVATMSNIGPGLGGVGPTDNFAFIPTIGKWFLAFLMLVGRLEIFTVMVLLSRSFWRR